MCVLYRSKVSSERPVDSSSWFLLQFRDIVGYTKTEETQRGGEKREGVND